MDGQATLVGAGEGGQIRRQAPQPPGLGPHEVQLCRRRRDDLVDHPLQISVDDRQRGAHFMGDIGDECGASSFGVGQRFPEFVDVVSQVGQLAIVRQGDAMRVVAIGQPSGCLAHLPQRPHQPVCRDGAGHGRPGHADEDPDEQGLVDR